ncbi:MAG: aldehyde-activating protein [Alphaproteobacteria bacterium]|nr:MAG: aldehyde-activating protein [Alphaproteobacteria bacterium]
MVTTGGCLCGLVRYCAEGTPRSVHYCHCRICRHATGGPFAVLVWFEKDDVQWSGQLPSVHRSSDIAQRGFCGTCGAPLFLHYLGGETIALMAGSLDEPERFAPDHHYGVESRLRWSDCGAGLPEEETQERVYMPAGWAPSRLQRDLP